MSPAKQCAGTLLGPRVGRAVVAWTKQCGNRTRHESGYCHWHRTIPGRGTWSEPCACGRDIRVPNIPLDRAMWSEQDWASITVAVSAHQRTPEHVAYRMGYRANILPRSITLDGLPVVGGIE